MKKKKVFLIATAAVVVMLLTASGTAPNGGWVKVKGSCEKQCKITKLEYKCGKCNSSMNSDTPEWDEKMVYLVYTFKCTNSKCKHSCVYKTKI